VGKKQREGQQAMDLRSNQPVKACVCILGYTFFMSILGACIKLVSQELSFEVIVFFRNFFALVILMGLHFFQGRNNSLHGPKDQRPVHLETIGGRQAVKMFPSTKVIHLHLIRSLFGLGAMYCYFYTLGKLSLAEATLLSYTSPVFIPCFAWLWLRESVSFKSWIAVVLGFGGIVFILRPGSGIFNITALVGICAGMGVAIASVTIRRMSDTESPGTMVFYFTLISTLVSALPLAWTHTWPDPGQFFLLSIMGIVAVLGQFFMAKAYTLAPSATVGPFNFTTVVFSSVLGWVCWNETLDCWFFAGALLICISGIFAARGSRGQTPSPDKFPSTR